MRMHMPMYPLGVSSQDAWSRPGYDKLFAKALMTNAAQSRGHAPQARHFRREAMLATGHAVDDDDI